MGGTTNTGGTSNVAASAITGGGTSSGTATSTGGSPSIGGTLSTIETGASGGTSAVGGTNGTGGQAATGGTSGSGGMPATGGATTGGANATGGATGAAGTSGSGGTGGGGTGTGGAASGGGSNCTACSHAITLQSESVTALHGSNGSSGVTYYAYQDRCPGNQVLIGYAGTLRDDVYQLSGAPVLQLASLLAICGTVTVNASGGVTVTPSSGIDARGTDAAAGTFSQICPTNQVVVGFAGHASTIIDQIGFVCARLQSASGACCCSALTIGPNYAFTPEGGTGGSAYSESCPSGQVALGQDLYTATTTTHVGEEWVSLFGLLCGMPMPVVACGS